MKSKILLTLALLLVVAAAWLGWTGYRTAVQARLALADLRQLQALAEKPSPQALPELNDSLTNLEAHLTGIQDAAGPLLGVAPLLGWLPQIGPTVRDAPDLLAMGIELATGGHMALDALMPAADLLDGHGQGDLLAEALPVIAGAAPDLAAADVHLARAEELRSQVRGPLHPRLAPQLARLDRFLPLIRAGLRAAQAAPSLMGMDGARTYLILAQNSDELRPTGGFISGVGHVRLENGRITDIKLSDSYAVDNFKQPHPDPPPALREEMGADLLLLRDSNWSPDFPTSAQVARALYAQDQGISTDGAIAIDLEAVRLLVSALGPLQVPGQQAPVTGANVIAAMKQAWESPATSSGTIEQAGSSDWWVKRKDFMGEMVAAALAKVQSGSNLDAVALATAVLQMLDGRHLQIAVDDPTLSALLDERGWDGAVQAPASGDFLAIIDANVGFNKTNAVVQEQIGYQVASDADGLLATLTLTYTHTAHALPAGTPCDRTPRYGDSYEEMTQRCYWDYLRVYIPADSALVSAEGLQKAAAAPGEGHATVISGDFTLRPGDRNVVTLRYRLPQSVTGASYHLLVRKQAGTLALPFQVEAETCAWQTDLAEDRSFACSPAR